MDSEDFFANGYATGETQSRKIYPIPVQGIQELLQIDANETMTEETMTEGTKTKAYN